jgi:hypothetical protein
MANTMKTQRPQPAPLSGIVAAAVLRPSGLIETPTRESAAIQYGDYAIQKTNGYHPFPSDH